MIYSKKLYLLLFVGFCTLAGSVGNVFAEEEIVSEEVKPVTWNYKNLNEEDSHNSFKLYTQGCTIYVHIDGGVTIYAYDNQTGILQYLVFASGADTPVRRTENAKGDVIDGLAGPDLAEKYLKASQNLPPEVQKIVGGYWDL